MSHKLLTTHSESVLLTSLSEHAIHTPPIDKYNALFATSLRAFMDKHPDTGEKTTQKALADYLGVSPQTVSYYCTGESLPNCEQLLSIAYFFGITCDFFMTGPRVENKPVRELLGLWENTVQNMKLVKEGYFEDSPYMLTALNTLLGDKADISMARQTELMEKPVPGHFTFNHFCEIHRRLMGDVFEFAGHFRYEDIAKGETRFLAHGEIKAKLTKLLLNLFEENYLRGLDREPLVERSSYYFAELNYIHPFREGNGRAMREFMRLHFLKN